VPIDVEGLAVSGLLGPSLQEHETDFGLLGDPKRPDVGVGKKSVVQPVLDESAILLGLLLNGNKRSDEVSSATSARSAASDEGTKLEIHLVNQTLGRLRCVVTKDSDRLRCLEGEDVVLVLQKNGGSGTVLADVLAVVLANISARGTGEVPVTKPGADGRESVQPRRLLVGFKVEGLRNHLPASRRVDSGEVLVLTKVVVRRHLTDDHIVNSRLRDGAVVDHRSDVAAEVRANTSGSTVVAEATRHVHVKTTLNRRDTRVDGTYRTKGSSQLRVPDIIFGSTIWPLTPIRHDVSLEAELSLQDAVLGLGVFASVGAVESLVSAHERSCTSLHSIGERPEVKLVKGSVVHVGRDGLLHDSVEGSIGVVSGVALSFLLVANVMLSCGLHSSILDAHNGLVHADACKKRIRREAFPITARIS
jgi:hypothetical protein